MDKFQREVKVKVKVKVKVSVFQSSLISDIKSDKLLRVAFRCLVRFSSFQPSLLSFLTPEKIVNKSRNLVAVHKLVNTAQVANTGQPSTLSWGG